MTQSRKAKTVVAAIFQCGATIASAGSYLHGLTRKAAAGQFLTGPMLMALIGSRKREKKQGLIMLFQIVIRASSLARTKRAVSEGDA